MGPSHRGLGPTALSCLEFSGRRVRPVEPAPACVHERTPLSRRIAFEVLGHRNEDLAVLSEADDLFDVGKQNELSLHLFPRVRARRTVRRSRTARSDPPTPRRDQPSCTRVARSDSGQPGDRHARLLPWRPCRGRHTRNGRRTPDGRRRLRRFREVPAAYVASSLQAFVRDASIQQSEHGTTRSRSCSEKPRSSSSGRSRRTVYSAILEYQLPMEARRPDVVLLLGGPVLVLELKGKSRANRVDLDQAAAYARDLRGYHRECADREVQTGAGPDQLVWLPG